MAFSPKELKRQIEMDDDDDDAKMLDLIQDKRSLGIKTLMQMRNSDDADQYDMYDHDERVTMPKKLPKKDAMTFTPIKQMRGPATSAAKKAPSCQEKLPRISEDNLSKFEQF